MGAQVRDLLWIGQDKFGAARQDGAPKTITGLD
jgi:hypothetical protein